MINLDLDQQTPCELQFVGVPLVSKEVCKNTELGLTYRDAIGRDLPDVQLCAGHMEGGRDACQVSLKNQKLKNIFQNHRYLSFSSHIRNFVFGCFWRRSYQNII